MCALSEHEVCVREGERQSWLLISTSLIRHHPGNHEVLTVKSEMLELEIRISGP